MVPSFDAPEGGSRAEISALDLDRHLDEQKKAAHVAKQYQGATNGRANVGGRWEGGWGEDWRGKREVLKPSPPLPSPLTCKCQE